LFVDFFNFSHKQVVNVSTPANYFHVLRRQLHRSFRKPLVIATPKSLLRHKSAVSSFADMSEGTRFLRLIPDTSNTLPADPAKVRRIVFCTGKIYYELEAARAASQGKLNDVAIVRVEQVSTLLISVRFVP
jgi:2-oxoglutarate dehydrogenase E1 component